MNRHQDEPHNNSNPLAAVGVSIGHSRANTAQRGEVIILLDCILTLAGDGVICPEIDVSIYHTDMKTVLARLISRQILGRRNWSIA